MERKRRKRERGLLVLALTLFVAALGLVVAPNDAWAAEGDVAQIGTETYATLDEAIEAANDGDTIELLADATTNGFNLRKSITIEGAEGLESKPTVTFTQYGIALWSIDLTFKDCNVVMNGIGSTPYTGEWNWMSICASVNATLTLDDATMTMDATGTTNSPHAIYFCNNNKLNIVNGSKLTISNYGNDALEWDGGDEGYNVNIIDSTFISDHNRSGFTGTFYATITNSTVDVINSTGNGSNGSHFIIKDSEVNFSDNGSHGLSAGVLEISGSVVTVNNNGGMGITANNNLAIKDNSTVTVTGNCTKTTSGYAYAAMRLYNDHDFVVDGTSELYINNNYNTGLYVRQGDLKVEDGAVLEIMGNVVSNNLLDGYGGGLYVGYGTNYDPTVTLPSDAKIYNNHATTAGDDIYISEGVEGPKVTFGATGSDWKLDGGVDCAHAIDGWYDDSEAVSVTDPDTGEEVFDPETGEVVTTGGRWNAEIGDNLCSNDNLNHHVEKFEVEGTTTVTGAKSLKAAHGEETVELKLAGVKALDGRALAAGEFSFVLMDADGTELQTVSNAADGSFSFDALSYDISAVGNTYKYVVSEVAPEDDDPDTVGVQNGNVTYDTDPVIVTVNVKLVDGELVYEASYEKAGVPVDSISFANTYQAEEPVTPGDDTTVDDGSGDDVTTDGGEATSSGEGIPKTGDPTSIAALALAAAAGLGAIGAGALVGRRRR